jgi:hypothetical protein
VIMTHIEIFIIIQSTILVSVLYSIYRYFSDVMNSYNFELQEFTKEGSHKYKNLMRSFNDINNTCNLLKEKIESGIKNNANCCKVGLERHNKEFFDFNKRILRIEQTLYGEEKVEQ